MAKSRNNCKRGKKGGFGTSTMGSMAPVAPAPAAAPAPAPAPAPAKEGFLSGLFGSVKSTLSSVQSGVTSSASAVKNSVSQGVSSIQNNLSNSVSGNNVSPAQSGGFKANDDFGIASDAAPVRYTPTAMPNKWIGGKRRKSRKTRKTRKSRRSRRNR